MTDKNSEAFDEVDNVITEFFEDKTTYCSSGMLHEAFDEHRLAKAALLQLKTLYEKTNHETFLALTKDAILEDTGSPELFTLFEYFDNENLEHTYEQELDEFKRNFFVNILKDVPFNLLVRFLVESIGDGSITKEVVDRMLLHPDAPQDLKDLVRISKNFNDVCDMGERMKKDKKWHDFPKSPSDLITEMLIQTDEHRYCITEKEYPILGNLFKNIGDLFLENPELTVNYDSLIYTADFAFFYSALYNMLAKEDFGVEWSKGKIQNKDFSTFIDQLVAMKWKRDMQEFVSVVRDFRPKYFGTSHESKITQLLLLVKCDMIGENID